MNNLKKSRLIRFDKKEIYQIMELYSKKISIGEWKDYSISFEKSHAIFAIHRSFKLGPCLEIKKNYKKDSMFTLTSQNNVITSSKNLGKVINYLKKPYLKLVK
tara:strand:- start:36 stop:344 length:309 start_codon:yes stop_codon:yes gene_type:complete